MNLHATIASSVDTIGMLIVAMALIGVAEALIPLHGRRRWGRAHLAPNLALTLLTFATNLLLNLVLLAALSWTQDRGYGLLRLLALPDPMAALIAVASLDLSFYGAHVAMHRIPFLWRFHRVHHCDPAVDVTTTLRQHPGESLFRYACLTASAVLLGASPAAFGLYRGWSALNGLLEHADIRVPTWLDRALSLVTTWPGMHKVHHSRQQVETDTNYGNIFSLWDRLFRTFTPTGRAGDISCGLDGFDDPSAQTTAALLASPFDQGRSARATLTP